MGERKSRRSQGSVCLCMTYASSSLSSWLSCLYRDYPHTTDCGQLAAGAAAVPECKHTLCRIYIFWNSGIHYKKKTTTITNKLQSRRARWELRSARGEFIFDSFRYFDIFRIRIWIWNIYWLTTWRARLSFRNFFSLYSRCAQPMAARSRS